MSQGTVKQIGTYQYNEMHCLGEGAYGKVFQGQNIKTLETVAIKKLDLALFEKDQYLRNQIVSEIEILKKFNHSNIVKFIELVTTQRSLYIVTEFCKDGDLKQLLLKKRCTEAEVIEIMIQIINGFKELVKLGIIHRDLKPANILNHEGEIKIADFGFAKYVDNYTSQLLRSCVGSPLYMAPQVLSRKSYSTKCDIWSIGVIYYEMLFHEVPWKGKDEQDLLRNIQTRALKFKEGTPYSKFSEDFLTRALCVEESERLTWDEVFSLLQTQEKQQTSTSVKKIEFANVGEEDNETIQKIPTWMDRQNTKVQPIGSAQLQKNLKMFISDRQEIAFRHFVCVELKVKLEALKLYSKRELVVEEMIALLSKSVLSSNGLLLQNISDTCDQGELILQKGTKWNIYNNLKKEQEFYLIFYNDFKEELDRNKNLPKLMRNSKEFGDFYDNETYDDLQKLEQCVSAKAIALSTELNDEMKRRIHDQSVQKENYDVGIQAEYLADLAIIRRRCQDYQEIDYDLLHSEKSQDEDLKKLQENTTQKIKQALTF